MAWSEGTITFNNAPAMDPTVVGSSGPFVGGAWTSVDVTSIVTGSGLANMALATTSQTQVSLGSRESGTTSPRLVVETSGSGAATATPTALATSTATSIPTVAPATATATSVAPSATPTATTTSGGTGNAMLPLRAAFYYPWFSPAWTQQGIYPYTKYNPTLGFYDERNQATVKAHIAAMQYGNISAGIASWWGQGSYTDARVADLLSAAAGTGFQWAVYYEAEGQGDPTVSQITADLTYIRDHYASNANFLHISGRFVVFVYADAADACGMADRWAQANTVNAYVVLKVFPGYQTCASQPDGWHQYSPAVAADSQGSYSYAISPGFDKVGETTRLARDLTRWQQNVADMTASSAAFQLVTTFNEWGEGTAVESANEWASPSGHGAYLDVLHNSPVTGTAPPTATPPAATATPLPTLTPTPAPVTASPTATAVPATPTATSIPPTPTASVTHGSSSTLSFAPVADAYVNSSSPNANYGTRSSIRVDGSPVVESYLRFDVQGTGSVTSATLKVWANSSQSEGYDVYGSADNSWDETGITFNNAPSFDASSTGSSGPVVSSSWTSVDVTSLVSGDGQISFVLLTPSSTALALASRESGATAPQLVITMDSATGGSPSPTATATQSAPIPTPTAVSSSATPTPAPPTSTATPSPTPTTAPATSGPCGTALSAPATYQHVIWIWMENHRYSDVIGNAAAPYTTQLARQCGAATNYAIVGSPSLPNYIGATSGSTFGISDDNPPSSHVLTGDNLFRQVRTVGMTEKSYQESMPSNCLLSNSGTYAVKHNPAAYYAGGSDRTACQANDVPMGTTSGGAFLNDLNNGTLPNFSFVTPNLCNDTHDCSVATGDSWLQSWVPRILASSAYQSGTTALIIMWDEYTPIPNVIITPSTVPGTLSGTRFDHYSLLRTTEEMLGITTYLGNAATAPSMRSAFGM